nr:nicotinamide-nucleotide amidohydrolase family protein [Naumannella cuiyingiana]
MPDAAAAVAALRAAGRTAATCESLTGGLLGAAITAVPGASVVYRGGLITYATDSKETLAGVPARVLARYGAVSPETAELLADGARRRLGADVAVALTGVAGPDPQEGHPAGTVWVGWADGRDRGADRVTVAAAAVAAGRSEVRYAAATAALARLVDLGAAASGGE